MGKRYFITGAQGCIGAWVCRRLLERGDVPVAFDLSEDRTRLAQVCGREAAESIQLITGDITDTQVVRDAIEKAAATQIVHLAGLQVPFCQADPVAGAKVNVIGTLNVFEAAAKLGIKRISYASSAAVYGRDGDSAVSESEAGAPATQYGVFKQANEGNARVYFQGQGISSVGLRPLTVYGVGRDRGLTSGPSSAMKAAALGQGFKIAFSGLTDFVYAADVADAFIAAADGGPQGAVVMNIHGETAEVSQVASMIQELNVARGGKPVSIDVDGPELPIAPELDDSLLRKAYPDLARTSLKDGITAALNEFAALQADGRMTTDDLGK